MKYIIKLSGRIDSASAQSVEEKIDKEVAKLAVKPDDLELDCSNLEYISSTGLRIILKYRKLYPALKVSNTTPKVYSVFEMTGFTRIIKVTKALRHINVDECKLLSEGGYGAVYRINEEEIVKISKYEEGNERLVYENEKMHEAFLLGLPTVISFDTVDCGKGRNGIVMEALDSLSLGEYLTEDSSRMDNIVPKYVELFRQTNSIKTDSPLFPNIKEYLQSFLELPQRIINDEEAALFSSILDEIPDSKTLVHFDGHTGNVLLYGKQTNRNLMLIDLDNSGKGHPVLELAGITFLLLLPDYAKGRTKTEVITGMNYELSYTFCRRCLSEMFGVTNPIELDQLVYRASLVGRIKSMCFAQQWATVASNPSTREYLQMLVKETLTLVPEIKKAVRYFVGIIDGNTKG